MFIGQQLRALLLLLLLRCFCCCRLPTLIKLATLPNAHAL
jgi:hypothetical protein